MPRSEPVASAIRQANGRATKAGPGRDRSAMQVVDERSGNIVLDRVREARGPWESFKGLMLDASLPHGHGLLFRPARGIHTHFMRFPIDLIFLDEAGAVVRVREAMRPWRFDFTFAAAVIEANAGAARAAGIAVGDRLRFDPPLTGEVG